MPKLYLVPNSINEEPKNLLPNYILHEIKDIRVFFVEEPKSARRLLKSLDPLFPLNDCRYIDLNEHSKPKDLHEYSKTLKESNCAIISEAGCPCVADPGADLVLLAHHHKIEIIPLVGPSSILLALMASGLSGQNFAFNGYLPKDRQERIQKIRALEERSHRESQTQIFMETPYRNQNMLDDILQNTKDNTCLCVASDITASNQCINTMSIKEWKKHSINIDKKPTIFIIYHP